MSQRRLARVGEQLKRELSSAIRHDLRDPDVGIVTVTGVDVTSDLWLARVYVQATGSPEEQRRTVAGLNRAAPFLRSTLGRSLHIRRMPELRFFPDESIQAGQRIEEILKGVLPEQEDLPGEEE
ncbi:MAG: 30S ribosome-binding factor RbfA [Longimicrobiales bacterium]